MLRHWAIVAMAALLGGCGLGETAATAAASGASSAEAARQARETQARVQAQLEAAQSQAAEQRQAIEEAGQ